MVLWTLLGSSWIKIMLQSVLSDWCRPSFVNCAINRLILHCNYYVSSNVTKPRRCCVISKCWPINMLLCVMPKTLKTENNNTGMSRLLTVIIRFVFLLSTFDQTSTVFLFSSGTILGYAQPVLWDLWLPCIHNTKNF